MVRMVQPAAEGTVEQGGWRCHWFVPFTAPYWALFVAVSEEGRWRGLMYKPVTKLSPM